MVALEQSRRSEAAVARLSLRCAATFFALAVLVHNSDHLRRGRSSVEADVFTIGSLAMILEVGIVVMAFMGHRLTPLAASVLGFTLASGYLFVHFTPSRSWLSDSFTGGASALSVSAASLEVIAALALGVVGLVALRRGSREPEQSADTTFAAAIVQPVPAAMLLGTVAIFIASIA